jgi:hypothetical protein
LISISFITYFDSVATKINEFIRKDTESPALNLNSDTSFTCSSGKENVSEFSFSHPLNEDSFSDVGLPEESSESEETKINTSLQRYPVSFIIMGILVVATQFIFAFAVFYYYSHSGLPAVVNSPNNSIHLNSPKDISRDSKVLELPSTHNGGMREANFSDDIFVQIHLSSEESVSNDLCLQQGKSTNKGKSDNPLRQIYNAIPSLLYPLSISQCKSNMKR